MNYFCGTCGGLVDLIGMQPRDVKLCDCAKKQKKLVAKLAKLEKRITYEERVIEYETALNEAMDKWFSARPSLSRNVESEFVFTGGFRMAWEARGEPKPQAVVPDQFLMRTKQTLDGLIDEIPESAGWVHAIKRDIEALLSAAKGVEP